VSLMKVLSYRNDCGYVLVLLSCDVRMDRYSGLVSDEGSGLGYVGFQSFRNRKQQFTVETPSSIMHSYNALGIGTLAYSIVVIGMSLGL
jgi:hypothetical protein